MTQIQEIDQDIPLGHKLIKKSFWLYFFMVISAPLGYFIRVIVSNTLSVEDVGLFYSILGLIGLISVYNDLGLTEALQYYLPQYWIKKEYDNYKTILYMTIGAQFISGIIIGGLLYLGSDWLAVNHFRSEKAGDILRMFCWYFIGINFVQVFSSIYVSFQDVFSDQLTSFLRLFTTFVFTLVFWLSGMLTLGSFSFGWLFGVIITTIVCIVIFLKKYLKTLQRGKIIYDVSLLRKQFGYAFWVFLGANAGTLLGQIDQQMIVNYLGTADAGYYANFYSLFGIATIILGPIMGILFPITTELVTKQDFHKLTFLQNIFYKYFTVFSFAIGGFLATFGPAIAVVLFGERFYKSGELLQYAGFFVPFVALLSFNFQLLAGLGKVKQRVLILASCSLIIVILNILLIPQFGLRGAVIATSIARILLRYMSFRIISEHSTITFNWKFMFGNISLTVIVLSLLSYFSQSILILENNYRYSNIVWLGVFGIVFCCILSAVNYKSIILLLQEVKNLQKSL